MKQAKVIDRIQKLLRLSKSSSVHEAEAAAAQAQRLMTGHRIDVAMLADTPEEVDVHWDLPVTSAKRLDGLAMWRMTLVQAIADANGCRTIIGSDEAGFDLCVIGVSDDVALVSVAYKYLAEEVDRLARTVARPPQTQGKARRWLSAFRQGAADRLAERIDEAVDEAEDEARHAAESTGTGAALVRVTDAIALLEERHQASMDLEKQINPDVMETREQTLDVDPYIRGHVAADTIALAGHRDKIASE